MVLSKIFVSLLGLTSGSLIAYFVYTPNPIVQVTKSPSPQVNQRSVIGFLPFWLINDAKSDYKKYLNEITYFDLTIDSDGHIKKYDNAKELNPGWNALSKNKFNNFGLNSSIAIFSGDDETINQLILDPTTSAQNLVSDLVQIIDQYQFSKINIDIEKVKDANPDDRENFTKFVEEVRKKLDPKIKISLDVTASSFVKETNLTDPKALSFFVDQIIIMAYDYHNPSSAVTGPVAPLNGAGVISEYDVETAIKNALITIPKEKIILGIPLYGYSWETVNEATRSATIPYSYITYSNKKAESLEGIYDSIDQEMYSITKDVQTGVYRQTFYPNQNSTQSKIDIAKKYDLGGVALWALGYEGDTILQPLLDYLNQ